MKGKKTDLHELIIHLEKQEVRHIRNELKKHHNTGTRPYLKMFDILLHQKQYDEQELHEKMPKGKRKRHIHHWKSELHNLVLRLLVEINKNSSAQAKLFELLEAAEILRRKRLHRQSHLMLDKAEAIARKFEYHNYELEINKIRRGILRDTFPKDYQQVLRKQISGKDAILLKMQNEYSYRDVSDRIFMMIRKFHELRDPDSRKDIEEMMKAPNMQNANHALNIWAKLSFHYSHYRYHRMFSRDEQANKHIRQIVRLWDLHPHRKKEYPLYYRQTISNLISSNHSLNDFSETGDLIAEAKKYSGKSRAEKATFFQEIAAVEFMYYLNTGKLDSALQFAEEVNYNLHKHRQLIQNSHWVTFKVNIAITYFLTDQPMLAHQTLDQIIAANHSERRDLLEFSLVFQLVLLHMADNHEKLEYQLRSVSRSISSGNLQNLEKFMVKQLKAILQLTKQEHRVFFADFLKNLQKLRKEDNIGNLGYEEICLWAQAHIEKKGIQEVFMANINKSAP